LDAAKIYVEVDAADTNVDLKDHRPARERERLTTGSAS
jgi:hypothetical protein